MRFGNLIAAALVLSVPGAAGAQSFTMGIYDGTVLRDAEWWQISKRKGLEGYPDAVSYIERKSVKRTGDTAEMWMRVVPPDGEMFAATDVLYEVKCAERRFRPVTYRYLAGHASQIAHRDEEDTSFDPPAAQGSLGAELIDYACGATDRWSAMGAKREIGDTVALAHAFFKTP